MPDMSLFCFNVAVASREPPFTARQLIIARLGNLTSLNNSEVHNVLIVYAYGTFTCYHESTVGPD